MRGSVYAQSPPEGRSPRPRPGVSSAPAPCEKALARMRLLLPARLLTALRPDSGSRFDLPGDVVRESRRRVLVAAAIGAAAYALFLLVQRSGVLGGTAAGRRIDFVHDLIGL